MPGIEYAAKQLRSAVGVVYRRMRFVGVPFQPSGMNSTAEHCLPVGHAGEGDGIERTERMEWIALVCGARNGGIEKPEIERRVVSNQDGALAAGGLGGSAHWRKHMIKRGTLLTRGTKRMINIDAGDFH